MNEIFSFGLFSRLKVLGDYSTHNVLSKENESFIFHLRYDNLI